MVVGVGWGWGEDGQPSPRQLQPVDGACPGGQRSLILYAAQSKGKTCRAWGTCGVWCCRQRTSERRADGPEVTLAR